jgi:hypothetical protein
LTDLLTTERTASQSLSCHITTYQHTIQELTQKLQTLEVTHETKLVEIDSLNQMVEELHVEIVDLKRKSAQRI